MTVEEILAPGDVIVGLRVPNKAALLEDLARRSAVALGIDAAGVLAALLRREELGSTGVGDGLALPHARLDAVRHPLAILARLRDPLDFDAVDERPVDLVVLLLLPAGDGGAYLTPLACIARRLRDPGIAAALRRARDAAALYSMIAERTHGKT